VPFSYRTVQDIAEDCDALVREGKPAQAVAGARAALKHLPRSAVLWERLGFALLAARDARNAETAFRSAIRLGERVPSVWDGLASALFRQGRRAEAEVAIREALGLAPNDPELLADLARIRSNAGARPK
jgi:cytochrome c-type biogenesis protein CcmH/NrfG